MTEELQFNPFTKISKQWGLVSAGTEEKSNTMTVSWGGVGVLWGKNVVFVFIRESRYTKEFIDAGDTFSLAFLPEELHKVHSFCGSKSGRDYENKWESAGITAAVKNGVVYPAEAELVFLCKKLAKIPIGEETFIDPELMPRWYGDKNMHTMYVGEILETMKK